MASRISTTTYHMPSDKYSWICLHRSLFARSISQRCQRLHLPLSSLSNQFSHWIALALLKICQYDPMQPDQLHPRVSGHQ